MPLKKLWIPDDNSEAFKMGFLAWSDWCTKKTDYRNPFRWESPEYYEYWNGFGANKMSNKIKLYDQPRTI